LRLGVECALVEGDLVRGDVEITDGRIFSADAHSYTRAGQGAAADRRLDEQIRRRDLLGEEGAERQWRRLHEA